MKLFRSRHLGQSLAEYAIILILVAIGSIAGLTAVGAGGNSAMQSLASLVNGGSGPAVAPGGSASTVATPALPNNTNASTPTASGNGSGALDAGGTCPTCIQTSTPSYEAPSDSTEANTPDYEAPSSTTQNQPSIVPVYEPPEDSLSAADPIVSIPVGPVFVGGTANATAAVGLP